MVALNPAISIITLNVNCLNILIKKIDIIRVKKYTKIQLYVVYKKSQQGVRGDAIKKFSE